MRDGLLAPAARAPVVYYSRMGMMDAAAPERSLDDQALIADVVPTWTPNPIADPAGDDDYRQACNDGVAAAADMRARAAWRAAKSARASRLRATRGVIATALENGASWATAKAIAAASPRLAGLYAAETAAESEAVKADAVAEAAAWDRTMSGRNWRPLC